MANRRNIKKWVKALRSGMYLQGHQRLAYLDYEGVPRYCCLGVACEVAIENGLRLKVAADVYGEHTKTYNGSVGLLPTETMEWLGLPRFDPKLDFGDGLVISASKANDDRRFDFDTIANAIERTYLHRWYHRLMFWRRYSGGKTIKSGS